MNRVKLWVFTVLVAVAAFLALRAATAARRSDAIAALDARLASAAAQVYASTQSIARQASAAAAFAAGDQKLVAALHAKDFAPPPLPRKASENPPPPAELTGEEAAMRDAARAALDAAEKAFGYDLPAKRVVTAANRAWLARNAESGAAEGEAMLLLRGAMGGQPRHGFVRQNGALWYGAAAPAGDGAGVMVLVPLDESWAKALATGAGADVTLSVPEVKGVSTAKPADVPLLQGATKLAGAGDAGRSGWVDISVGKLKLPRMPQPTTEGGAFRTRAVPLEGVKNGFVVVSVPESAALDPAARFFWRALAGVALVLLAAVVLGLLFRRAEPAPQLPEALHAAAARIVKGDFAARAPPLAGKLGTVAAALNSAAEIAGPAQAARGAPAPAALPAATEEDWFQAPARSAPPPPRPAARNRSAGAAELAPAPEPEADEDAHWQQVFQEFLRTRGTCGEASEGLGYDTFRQKLERNKAQLVAKYGCKTVRFQVYVKDGKTALKATPVK